MMIAHTDGGARPGGPAMWAWIISDAEGREVARDSGTVDASLRQTSNVAEFVAILRVLEHACHHGIRLREVRTDSQLIANQVNARWRCKAAHLRPLRDRVGALLGETRLRWIPRQENGSADALTREAYAEWCVEAGVYSGGAP